MGRFTKRLIGGLAAASLCAGSAFAQTGSMLADFENGTNQNLFGQYWYFYDDNDEVSTITAENSASGSSEVTSAVRVGSELQFTGATSISTTEVHNGNRAAIFSYKFGRTMQMAWGTNTNDCTSSATGGCYDFEQFVGMGTNISPDGATSAPEGFAAEATAVKFWAKSTSPASVHFKPQQVNITDGADYFKEIDLTTGWAEYTVALSTVDLAQPSGWGTAVTFDKSKITKFAWQVQAGFGANPTPELAVGVTNTIYLDDIFVVGYTFIAHDMCMTCVGATGNYSGKTLLSDFEEDASATVGDATFYWYAYTDKDAGGNSTITDGVAPDPNNNDEEGLDVFAMGGGSEGSAGAAYIEFTTGSTMEINGNDVQPFVGIGVDIGDETEGYFNATANGVGGFYVEYMTGPGITSIDVEVQDVFDIQGDRPESAVRYIKLPGTDGAWKGATILWSQLLIHDEWDDVKDWYAEAPTSMRTLNTSQLAKIQFKYQGGANSYMAIDNAYLLGNVNIRLAGASSSRKVSGLRATYNRGTVGVNWNAAASVASGKISLVNTKGRVVASAPIAKTGNRITANLGAGRIPTGMYFVRIDARDVNGKRIVEQTPISVVR